MGGRLIDWRRSHARVCPEWPRWAEKKGLTLDANGALLYPNEVGPYEPRNRPRDDGADEDEGDQASPSPEPDEPRIDLMRVPAEDLEQRSLF